MLDKADDLEPENPFWQFSLRIYRKPGVPTACLTLQNSFGVDVNLLLFWIWSGLDAGIAASDVLLAKAEHEVAAWRTNVVKPLREVRSWLKHQPLISDATCVRLRDSVKREELSAEQIQQAMLFRLSQSLKQNDTPGTGLARSNASAYLKSVAVDDSERVIEIASHIYSALL